MRAVSEGAAGGAEDVAGRCAEDVTRLVQELFGAILPSEEAFAVLMDLVARRIDAALLARAAQAPACGPGCASCCSLNVGTLAVEGAAVAAYLRPQLGPDGARRKARALLRFHERVRWLDDGERIRERLPCPFLDEGGRCSIHPVRPLACRSVSSLDAEECRRAMTGRGDDDGCPTVRMDLLQLEVHAAAIGALSRALTARGLDARMRDVTGMTGVFLADAKLASAFGDGAQVPLE
jgi:Fe-S-cluster containining protein